MCKHPSKSIEKIINILGNKIIKDKYGLDLHFEIEKFGDVVKDIFDDEHIYIKVYLNVKGEIPYIFKDLSYDDNMWNVDRYGTYITLEVILNDIVKHINPLYWVTFKNVKNPHDHQCEEYFTLDSDDIKICKETGVTDNKNIGGLVDWANQDWWDSLTDNDKKTLKSFFG